MSTHTYAVHRIIDANINRAKEGLRVCEEIFRFIIENSSLAGELKKVRHRIDRIAARLDDARMRLKYRDSIADIGRTRHAHELKRTGYADIFFANMQRVKESIRVLEEFSKIKDTKSAIAFKKIRYDVYDIEKRAMGKIVSRRHHP